MAYVPRHRRLQLEADAAAAHAASGPPPPLSAKTLLILDLNNVLVARKPYAQRSSHDASDPLCGARRRPHLEPFLDFCFEHFAVAVWSCGKRQNMELALFEGRELAFAYEQEHSTNLWPRSSVVSSEKPLFLKELGRCWKEHRQFGPSNTLLVDNHLEKFERNPVGSCVLVPSFALDAPDDDAILALDGELVRHLTAMAAEGVDVRAYGAAAGSAYLPTAHPAAPAAEEGGEGAARSLESRVEGMRARTDPGPRPLRADLRGGGGGGAPSGGGGGGGASSQLRERFVQVFCSSPAHLSANPQLPASAYMRGKVDPPGPRAMTLTRQALFDGLLCSSAEQQWAVAEKSDGVRHLLLADQGETYLVDRSWNFSKVEGGGRIAAALGATDAERPTIADGELVQNHLQGAGADQRDLFILFDVARIGGADAGAERDLFGRLKALREGVLAPLLRCERKAQGGGLLPLKFLVKDMQPASAQTGVQSVLDSIVAERAAGGGSGEAEVRWYSDGERRTLNDGLIFTPVLNTFYDYLVVKWKPRSENTVDFKIMRSGRGGLDDPDGADLQISVRGNDVALAKIRLSAEQRAELGRACGRSSFVIVECGKEAGGAGGWKVCRVRADKDRSNSIQSGWRSLEVIIDNVTPADILQHVKGTRAVQPSSRASGWSASAAASAGTDTMQVATHYDEIQGSRDRQEQRDERIHFVRKVNNFAKSMLIDQVCLPGNFKVERYRAPSTSIPQSLFPVPQSFGPRGGSRGKQRGGGQRPQGGVALRILELACGRGGDMFKYTKVVETVSLFVGVDVSELALKEARRRAEGEIGSGGGGGGRGGCGGGNQRGGRGQRRGRGRGRGGGGRLQRATFVQADMGAGNLTRLLAGQADVKESNSFDVCSCQLAIHYVCDSAARAASFFRETREQLKVGGRLVVTVPDWEQIVARKSVGRADAAAIGNAIYSCAFKEPARLDGLKAGTDPWGVVYDFTLGEGDALDECPESVAYLPALDAIAQDAGFALEVDQNVGSFVEDGAGSERYSGLLARMNVVSGHHRPISEDEWAVVSFYRALIWVAV